MTGVLSIRHHKQEANMRHSRRGYPHRRRGRSMRRRSRRSGYNKPIRRQYLIGDRF